MKKNQNGFSLVIVILLLILLSVIITIGYLVVHNNRQNEQKASDHKARHNSERRNMERNLVGIKSSISINGYIESHSTGSHSDTDFYGQTRSRSPAAAAYYHDPNFQTQTFISIRNQIIALGWTEERSTQLSESSQTPVNVRKNTDEMILSEWNKSHGIESCLKHRNPEPLGPSKICLFYSEKPKGADLLGGGRDMAALEYIIPSQPFNVRLSVE